MGEIFDWEKYNYVGINGTGPFSLDSACVQGINTTQSDCITGTNIPYDWNCVRPVNLDYTWELLTTKPKPETVRYKLKYR